MKMITGLNRQNLGIHPSYRFLRFSFENYNLGLKMKVLKFLVI